MAKRSDTVETVLLAIEMLNRIPRGHKITADELHRQLKEAGLSRDIRTIQRQLEMLSVHFEIERDDRSKPYGYCWLKNARALAVPNLTAQESLLLRLAEEHLKNLLPARLMKSMDGFFDQARRNLSSGSDARLYLVCRYRGYDNERSLALHRILSAEASTLTFERPREFDLKKYDDDGQFGFGDGKRVRLSFRITQDAGAHLLETPLSADQQVTELKGGWLAITATVVDSAMLEWWLRGFGDAVSYVRRVASRQTANADGKLTGI